MPESNTYRIEEFVAELTRVSFSDILVNVKPENSSVFLLEQGIEDELEIPFSTRLNQLYKIAVQHKKTADIHSFCLAEKLFKWKYKDNEVLTPLFLTQVHVTLNKIKKCFHVRKLPDSGFINPFLLNTLAHEYQIISEQTELQAQWEEIELQLSRNAFPFEIIDFSALGNFHHHRYEIIRDLEELISLQSPNYLVRLLLGQSDEKQNYQLDLSAQNCFSSDPDQEEIFTQIARGDCVIQGPPGTGKSQVLSNLLAKLLHHGNMHLVVSEKRTALEVLAQKLKSRGLGEFAAIIHAQSQTGEFIQQLKKSWKKLELEQFENHQTLLLSKHQLARLQLILDKLNQAELLKKLKLSGFQQFAETDQYKLLPFISSLPDLSEWERLSPLLTSVFESAKNPELISVIRQSAWLHYTNIDEQLEEISALYLRLKQKINFDTTDELESLIKLSIRVQLMENESGKTHVSLIKNPAQFKKFEKLKIQFQLLQERIKLLQSETENWEILPSKSEIESWKIKLKQGNWFVKRKAQNEVHRRLKKNGLEIDTVLNNLEIYLGFKSQELDLRNELQKLGISQIEHELELVSYLAKQLNSIDKNELNEVEQLESGKRNQILENASELKRLERKLHDLLQLEIGDSIPEKLSQLKSALDWIVPLKKIVAELPNSVLRLFKICSNKAEMEAIFLKSVWVNFSALFPELAQVNGKQISSHIKEIIKSEHDEQLSFGKQILFQRQQKFRDYHELLSTPAVKLKGAQKELKTRLKNGKALLVKEFSKSKQHRSIRELLESDAVLWIELLCPLFLCTPVMVSKNLPLQSDFFECLIFDEASQLILPKALASLQRAKRVIIAGDEHQMSPTTYFSGSLSAVDLLHQASFYLPNFQLKHHYRSKHSQLISFSNRHFYKDQLIAYPAPLAKEIPIRWFSIKNGIYEDRQNIKEAASVARHIEKYLENEESMGIVAFSEQQLTCIWKQIDPRFQGLIEEKIRQNKLFMKPLEQVQGEECDRLIISLGYGKNQEGDFHLRFGPLNQKSGVKRLNVLFTRAIEHIDFFSSVTSSDFSLSNNEAINLLRLYLLDLENEQIQRKDKFPFGIDPEITGSNMNINEIYRIIPDAAELKTFHEVMTARSWLINYTL